MKILIVVSILIFLFSGCAVKKNDDILTKTGKHAINSPLYVGAIISAIPVVAIAGAKSLVEGSTKLDKKDSK